VDRESGACAGAGPQPMIPDSSGVSRRNRVCVVTGGTRGLGAAIAATCAATGSPVIVLARHAPAALARGIEWKRCDVADWMSVSTTVAEIESEIGAIGVLINNVGAWSGAPLEQTDIRVIQDVVRAVVLGTLLTTRAVLPLMVGRGDGSIVNIGSTSGLAASTDSALASATKAAIGAFSSALRRELAHTDIRVTVVHPASIVREPEDGVGQPGHWSHITPEQVADAIRFILEQPKNVVIRELTITPLHADY
jgi:NADP-dependent 3-hydroxy acid dehydrogenase YdfG